VQFQKLKKPVEKYTSIGNHLPPNWMKKCLLSEANMGARLFTMYMLLFPNMESIGKLEFVERVLESKLSIEWVHDEPQASSWLILLRPCSSIPFVIQEV
jgi:hypothetical protein